MSKNDENSKKAKFSLEFFETAALCFRDDFSELTIEDFKNPDDYNAAKGELDKIFNHLSNARGKDFREQKTLFYFAKYHFVRYRELTRDIPRLKDKEYL